MWGFRERERVAVGLLRHGERLKIAGALRGDGGDLVAPEQPERARPAYLASRMICSASRRALTYTLRRLVIRMNSSRL